MKKMCTKIAAVVLCVGLCLSQFGIPAFAAEKKNSEKMNVDSIFAGESKNAEDAVIYVITETDGKTKKVIVSDEIKENLKSAQGFLKKELRNQKDSICFDVDGNLLSWIDNVEDEMPVELSVRYTLDGKAISADELVGKSGHVKITYHYQNRQYENVDGIRTAVPFTVITGVIADDSVFSDLKVSNGKCVDDGNHTIVVGIAMPGLEGNLNLDSALFDLPEEVIIEGDAVDFELDSALTLVTNELFSQLDTSSLDNISSMLSATDQLSGNMKKLIDGSTELSGGIGTLMVKSAALTDAVSQISDGTDALAVGANQLDAGVANLKDGADDLSDGLNTLSEKGKELSAVGQKIFDVFLKACNFVLPLLPEFPDEYKTMTAENYKVVLDKIAECYGEKLPNLKDATDGLKKIGDFAQGICAYTAALDQAAEGAKQLQDGLKLLKDGSGELSDGLNTLNGGARELKAQSPQLVDGIQKLNNGAIQLSDGLKQFNSQGIEKLVKLLNGDVYGLLERFKATVNAAKRYRVFDGISKLEGQVTYVYKTEAVRHKDADN